jgi:hypothetical protein
MVRAFPTSVLAFLLAVVVSAQSPPVYDTPNLHGKLYRTVFVQGAGTLAAADLPAVPEPARGRLQRVLDRRAAFKSRLQPGASDLHAVAVEAKKRRLEAGICALIDAPEIQQLAADYAQAAKVLYEWEGKPDGPLAEATDAEDFLKRQPATPLAPYLYVLIAARQRAAFETMTPDAEKASMTAAAKKYRTFVQRARSAEDPIFRLLADDMDRQPYLHVKSAHHPRDFDPDT